MALRYAILGLLLDRPSSGYDLAGRFADVIGAYAWDAKHSQIYPELRRLDQEGLVEVVDRGARRRTTYRCTGEGLTALRAWLMAAPTSTGGVKNEHALRLFLLGVLEPEEALEVLRQTEAGARGKVQDLEAEFAALQERTGSASGGPLGLTVQLGIHSFRATAQWARWASEQLGADADLDRSRADQCGSGSSAG
ncbi:PadR family transcriptional regulator [Ornithinimicrobium murale]|uniref:PadR family transcriptional regulator n=1 Tax=Ornithinimicrobium murale TaxID=1050153 RepID=UPI000E0DB08D|nr:PadR family transcriptional regulator [Ornithinimicrobium murale]